MLPDPTPNNALVSGGSIPSVGLSHDTNLAKLQALLNDTESVKRAVGRPRKAVDDNGEWELQRLKAVHHQILVLHCFGLKNYEIAEKLDITPQTVSNTLTSEIAQPVLAEMYGKLHGGLDDVKSMLKVGLPLVVKEALELALNPGTGEQTKTRLLLGLMDRSKLGPTKTIEVEDRLKKSELMEVLERAKEGGFRMPKEKIEEASFTDITPTSE